MKQGWEIKKLGDITTSINGLWTGKKPPFITIAVIRNTNFTKDCKLDTSDIAYIDVEQKQYESRKLQYGDIIVEKSGGSDRQPVGRPVIFNIKDGDYSFSNFTSTLRVNDKSVVAPEFLHRYLTHIYMRGDTATMQSKTTGLRNLNFTLYKSIQVPIPPLPEQERIVAELDCLSGVIEKKREQLKELDALAQSIFYQMFGDEIGQSNKWDSCSIGDIYKFQYGKGNKIPESNGEYPCYGSNGQVGYHTEFNGEDSPIIGHIGAYAGIVIWARGKHYVTYNGVICKLKHKGFHPIYGYYLLKAQNYMDSARGGAAQPFVSYDMLEAPIVYMPPLTLQQEFADKIEAIEKQKELIKQSITETEELFNSRMDYYFN